MQQYEHPMYGVVTVLGAYSSHTNVMTSQGVKPVQPQDLRPISDIEPVELPAPGTSLTPVEPPTPIAEITPIEPPVPETELESVEDSEPDPNLVNLNKASVNQLNRELPFVGNTRAKKIVANRPKGGYESWEQFQEINASLFDDEKAWEQLSKLVTV